MGLNAYRRGPPGNDPAGDAIEELQAVPLNGGQLVEATHSGGAFVDVPHGLQRAYRGAIVVSAVDAGQRWMALDARAAQALNVDATRALRIYTSSTAKKRFTVWAF